MVTNKKYNIGWGLTNKCNMNCRFCYSKESRLVHNELGMQDWIRFIVQNSEYIESINYGTGENTILDDFFYFINYVRQKYPNIPQSLTTNGYVFEKIKDNPKFMSMFIKSIDEVDVSLDFFTPQKHNKFRGQSCAYNWAINLLALLKNTPIKTTIVFVGFKDTLSYSNIDGLFELSERYNAILRLNIYRPVAHSDEINKKFVLKYNVLVDALKYIGKKYKILSLSDALIGNVFSDEDGIEDKTGVESIRILPDGNIYASTYLIDDSYKTGYNILQDKVLQKIYLPDFETLTYPKECFGCKIASKCKGGAIDRRLLWYGTLQERDPYCPLRNGDVLPEEIIHIDKHPRISVHERYLPTLFFSSVNYNMKEEKNEDTFCGRILSEGEDNV